MADRASWTAYAEREGLLLEDRFSAALERERANKFHAEPVHVDGIRFASKKEAGRYLELRLLEKSGLITDLERQPMFPLHIFEIWRSGLPIRITTVGRYTADFRYCDLRSGEIVVEDVKSEATRTTAYRLRKRIAEAVHGITIAEV